MWENDIWLTAATVFTAALITGATGFGFNLFATPVLALLMPVRQAVVISLLVGVVVTATISALNARQVSRVQLRPLAGGALVGIAAGTVIFHAVSGTTLQIAVGALGLAAIPVFLLGQRRRALPIHRRGAAPAVGLVSGVMTAISGMGGPPVVGYLLAADTPLSAIRATIAAYSTAAAAGSFTLLAATSNLGVSPVIDTASVSPAALVGLAFGAAGIRARPYLYRPAAISSAILLAGLALILALKGIHSHAH